MPYVAQGDVAIGDLATAAERNTMKDNIHVLWQNAVAGGVPYFSATNVISVLKPTGPAISYHNGTVPSYKDKGTRRGSVLRCTASDIEFGYALMETCSVYSTVNQNIAADPSYLNVLWNAEYLDIFAWHSTSSNTGRITPDASGYYEAEAVLNLDQTTGEDNQYDAYIRLDGVDVAYGRTMCWAGLVGPVRITMPARYIAASSYLTVHVKHTKAGTRLLYAANSHFVVKRVE